MSPGSKRPGRCAACGAELTRHEQFSGGVCGDIDCRRRRVDAQLRVELLELQRLRDRWAENAGVPALSSAPVIALHRYEPGLGPIPLEQRHALRQHLMALQSDVDASLAAAGADVSPAAPAPALPSSTDELLAAVCARCGGFCCHHGNGAHAYLDAPALLRARLASPGDSHAQVVDAYLDEIPAEHHRQSCVFHGARGCVLPRRRRSDRCNHWECSPLREAREHSESTGGTTVFVVRGRRGQPSFEADVLTLAQSQEHDRH